MKKIGKSSNKLVKLQIFKMGLEKTSDNFETNLKQIEIHLNKISNILYKYHVANKRILFLGFPTHFSKILKKTKHILIPEFTWFNGMLSNRTLDSMSSTEKTQLPKNIFSLLLKLKKKIDLVIIYNLDTKSTAVQESYLSQIPVITLTHKLDILNCKTSYNSFGNYCFKNEKMKNNNFFFSFLKTTLKRAKKAEKVQTYKNLAKLKSLYAKKRKMSWGKKFSDKKK